MVTDTPHHELLSAQTGGASLLRSTKVLWFNQAFFAWQTDFLWLIFCIIMRLCLSRRRRSVRSYLASCVAPQLLTPEGTICRLLAHHKSQSGPSVQRSSAQTKNRVILLLMFSCNNERNVCKKLFFCLAQSICLLLSHCQLKKSMPARCGISCRAQCILFQKHNLFLTSEFHAVCVIDFMMRRRQ